jgi:hypothetical protein
VPKYPPWIGQSPARVDAWKAGAAATPTGEFELNYVDNGTTGYVASWGPPANRVSIPLLDLLDTNGDAVLQAQDWRGVMQPNNMTCRPFPGAAERNPRDYFAVESHDHRRWKEIDDGHPDGDGRGRHDHEIPLSDFLLYSYKKNGIELTQFYPRHLH